MAYSCKANALLSAVGSGNSSNHELINAGFEYGKNVGIAFQLVDDLLDFVSRYSLAFLLVSYFLMAFIFCSSEQLGKPAAADLQLGLATAPGD
jgi:geranylgeranyl pyrophosphate synthase